MFEAVRLLSPVIITQERLHSRKIFMVSFVCGFSLFSNIKKPSKFIFDSNSYRLELFKVTSVISVIFLLPIAETLYPWEAYYLRTSL